MQHRLNLKLLVGTAATVAAIGALVHVVHRVQAGRNAGALLVQADRAREQGRPDKAADHLASYLSFRPEDTEALARYGLMLDQTARTPRDRRRALSVLERVLGRAPDRHDVRRRAVRLEMALERHAAARNDLEILLRGPDPDDGELEELLGRCCEAQHEYSPAEAAYAHANEHAPGRIEPYLRRSALLRDHLGQPEQAERVLDAMVAANDGSYRAYLGRAEFRRKGGRDREAAADVARARELAPDRAEVILAAVDLALAGGDAGLDEARGLLRRGLERHPADVALRRSLADLELRAGRLDEAEQCLRQGLLASGGRGADGGEPDGDQGQDAGEDGPTAPELLAAQDRLDLLVSLAELLIQVGKLDEADGLIAQLRRDRARPELLDYLDAAAMVARRRWAEAARRLEGVIPLLAADPDLADLNLRANLTLAGCYGRLGDAERRLLACRRAGLIDPGSAAVAAELAAALTELGRLDEALALYRERRAESPAAVAAAARLLLARGPGQVAEGEWDELGRDLERAAAASPRAAEFPLLRAELLAARGRLDEARDLLEAARERQPDEVLYWVALAGLADRRGAADEALPLLDRAERSLGDRAEIRLARAEHWAGAGGDGAAAALDALEQGLDRFTPADRRRLLAGLADVRLRLGDADAAERLWARLVEQQPADLADWSVLFELALQAGHEEAMSRAVDAMRRVEDSAETEAVEGVHWRVGRARCLAWLARRGGRDARPFAEAQRLLTEAAAIRPSWARIPAIGGEIDEVRGDPEAAIASYRKAVELGERGPHVVRRLVRLLNDRRRYAEADEVIERLQLRDARASAGLRRYAAELSLGAHDPDRARALALEQVAPDSRDYRDHLWLGQLLWMSRRRPDERVEAELRRAVELGRSAPETWVALVRYLAASGRRADAEAALDEARRALPADRTAEALARGFEAIGLRDRAEQQYRAALEERPDEAGLLRGNADFYMKAGHFGQAEPLLRRLLHARSAAADAAWARRNLAVCLATRDPGGQFDAALALVEQNLGRDDDDPDDLRAKATILSLRPGRRREAIGILEDLGQRLPPTPAAQFLLANLAEAEGDWGRARDLMRVVLTSGVADPSYPLYLATYSRSLIDHRLHDEAAKCLGRLAALEPESFRTAELRARLLAARGLGEDAVALLKGYASGDDDGRRLAAAGLLEELGQVEAAEALYRDYVARSPRPESLLVLVDFFVRRGRAREAFDLCQQAWKSCEPVAVAQSSVAALYAKGAGDAECQQVARQVEAALRDDPDANGLLISLAMIRAIQGRDGESESLYRRVLAKDADNLYALNNLASSLAARPGRGPEALGLIERAIKAHGPLPELLDTRAVVDLAVGRADRAIEDLETAIAIRPLALMHFHLARAQHQAGDPDASARSLAAAGKLGLDPDGLDPAERVAYHQLVSDLGR